MVSASVTSVSRAKSRTSSPVAEEVTTEPWLRALSARIPASGNRSRSSCAKSAKERAEAPAPWWQMKRGPF